LEVLLRDLETDRPVSEDELDELVSFFSRATGLAAAATPPLPMPAAARIELLGVVAGWQDWFVGHVGGMCLRD
jgi:hypothetical protein